MIVARERRRGQGLDILPYPDASHDYNTVANGISGSTVQARRTVFSVLPNDLSKAAGIPLISNE
jgi:hypothetical protein